MPLRFPLGKRQFNARWLMVLLAVAGCALFTTLGFWQWHRGQYREQVWERFQHDTTTPAQATAARLPDLPRFTRVRVQGRLEAVELGEAGVVLLRLALADRPQGLRLVASPALAERAAAWAQAGAAPPVLSLDCLSQGVMMGEWLLVDCLD